MKLKMHLKTVDIFQDVNATCIAISHPAKCMEIYTTRSAKFQTKKLNQMRYNYPDSEVHGANIGPIWGRQGPGGPHVGPMNFAILGLRP